MSVPGSQAEQSGFTNRKGADRSKNRNRMQLVTPQLLSFQGREPINRKITTVNISFFSSLHFLVLLLLKKKMKPKGT